MDDIPPPPPPPPLVTVEFGTVSASATASSDAPSLNPLLASIQGGKGHLKKTETKDNSAPMTSRSASNNAPGPGRGPTGGYGILASMGGQPLPKLRPVPVKTGNQVQNRGSVLQAKTVTVASAPATRPTPTRSSNPSQVIPTTTTPFKPLKSTVGPSSSPKNFMQVSYLPKNFNAPISPAKSNVTPVKASPSPAVTPKPNPTPTPVVTPVAPKVEPKPSPVVAPQPQPQHQHTAKEDLTDAFKDLDDILAQVSGGNSRPAQQPAKASTTTTSTHSHSTSHSTPDRYDLNSMQTVAVDTTPVYSHEEHSSDSAEVESVVCARCNVTISTGSYMEALGKTWHPEHFECKQCQKQLSGEFFGLDDEPFCESCYFSKFICGKCGQKVTDDYISTDGKIYHPHCAAVYCHQCGKAVKGNSIVALGHEYHPECFKCGQCSKQLRATFIETEGMCYCVECANGGQGSGESGPVPTSTASMCTRCGMAITDQFLKLKERSWHPDCFKCSTCDKTLNTGASSMSVRQLENGSVMCESCFQDKSSTFCTECGKKLTGKYTEYDGKKMHIECFACTKCSLPLSGQFLEIEGKLMHASCFKCDSCHSLLDDEYAEVKGKILCIPCTEKK